MMRRSKLTKLQFACAVLSVMLTLHATGEKQVTVETYQTTPTASTLIILHGASGPSEFYSDQAKWFAAHKFRVLLPHYFDVTKGRGATEGNVVSWCQFVEAIVAKEKERSHDVFVVGYSLGASVALALGSRGVSEPTGIAEFYGSLPDKFYRDLKTMPPVLILHGENDTMIPVENAKQFALLCKLADFRCEMHLYPNEGHGFSPEMLKDADERTLKFFSSILSSPKMLPFER